MTKGQVMILVHQGQIEQRSHHKEVKHFKSLKDAWAYREKMKHAR